MRLLSWHLLPEELQQPEVKKYYDILEKKQGQLVLKRTFDFIVSFLLLIVLIPFFGILGIIIKFDSSGPVFYRQERITAYGNSFYIYKFRTMYNNPDKSGSLVTTKNDSRITKVGALIRKFRLDEFPQLINVLKGEMSFVGTRPEVRRYVEAYDTEMLATLLLPPGITSLASIKFKDEDEFIEKYISEEESIDEVYINRVLPLKMKYNLEYLKNFSLSKDLSLMVKTIFAVYKWEKIWSNIQKKN